MATMLKTINWQFSLGTANTFSPPPRYIHFYPPVILSFAILIFIASVTCDIWSQQFVLLSFVSRAIFIFNRQLCHLNVRIFFHFSRNSFFISHFIFLLCLFPWFFFFFFRLPACGVMIFSFFLILFFNIYFAFPYAL